MYKVIFGMILYLSLQSEHLPTFEQETTPPPSCIIQPPTGPALVQYNNNNNNIVDKRWTVSDEHCGESQEDTPVSIRIQMWQVIIESESYTEISF